MTSGDVHDLTGRKRGTTDDLEAVFLAAVEHAQKQGPCYVVVGTGSPPGFDDRIRALGAPILVDAALEDAALILAGTPDEWTGLDE